MIHSSLDILQIYSFINSYMTKLLLRYHCIGNLWLIGHTELVTQISLSQQNISVYKYISVYIIVQYIDKKWSLKGQHKKVIIFLTKSKTKLTRAFVLMQKNFISRMKLTTDYKHLLRLSEGLKNMSTRALNQH